MLNKLDMVPEDERRARVADFIERFGWTGPVFEISALTGQGCEGLVYAIHDYLVGIRTRIAPSSPRIWLGRALSRCARAGGEPHERDAGAH
ncbi:hypothetical protein [Burkholderia mallei]|uniref:hypothetical protein n=1 Tax=Burkholderia mallei TaxID=13373 RepID=UPI0036F2A625